MHDGQVIGNGGISIHALLAESDPMLAQLCMRPGKISIHALGVRDRPYCGISIHALLAESDVLQS